MLASISNTFDPETLIALRVAVDRALNSLPPDRRTAIAKSRIAKAVVQSATWGERDPARLSAYAVTEFDFVSTQGGRVAAL